MSVPESQRSANKLEVLNKTLEVSTYSIRIMANRKKFDPCYDEVLGKDIKSAALTIYRYTWLANDLKVTSRESYLARNELQRRAVGACNDLLIFINVAHLLYHLKGKRVEHWTAITMESRKLLRAWINAERQYYASYAMP